MRTAIPIFRGFLLGVAVAYLVIIPGTNYLTQLKLAGAKAKNARTMGVVADSFAMNVSSEDSSSMRQNLMKPSLEHSSNPVVRPGATRNANNRTITPVERAFRALSLYRNQSTASKISNAETTLTHSRLTPVLWHVPKSGGTTLKALIACLDIVIACEAGKYKYPSVNGSLSVNEHPSLDVLHRENFGPYVNIDMSSFEGIQAAHDLGFAEWIETSAQGKVVIVASLIQTAADLLFPANGMASDGGKGVLLVVLRDPIDRQVSLFHYLKRAKHEPTYHPEWENLTIADWNGGEDNWMVRVLSGVLEGDSPNRKLDNDDLQKAKDILNHYSLIGFTDRMDETLDRFGPLLGWNQLDKWDECRAKLGQTKRNSVAGLYHSIEKGSKDWHHVAKKNKLDMELFRYAETLVEQA